MNTKKSLAEQTNEILKARMSTNKKAEALVKLGITPYEAMVLAKSFIPVTPRRPQAPRQQVFTYTFGVEIECINCQTSSFFAAARRNNLDVFDQVFYNHRDMPQYKLTTDSSISGTNPAECVTPPLRSTDGFESLKSCCKTLSDIGARANSSCGLHVHIGARGLSDQEYCNVFVNYMRLETAIESFLAPSRRGLNSRWCQSLRKHENAVLTAYSKDSMCNVFEGRYYRVNAKSYRAHNTIEFRQHQGSTNFTKISNWVKFLGKLVEYSKTNRLTENIDRIEDIPFLTESEKAWFCNRRAWFESHRL